MAASRTMLVAGLSGLVGYATAKHFAALPDWDVIAISRRIPEEIEGVQAIEADLLDREACSEIFQGLPQVTNVVYAALFEMPGLISGWRDSEQREKNDAMLRNLMDPLQKVATGLQHVSLLQGTKAYGLHVDRMRIPARESSPRHPHENFYWLQEDYLREQFAWKDWSWTAWRPQLILGESLGSNMNVIPAIGVYAALQREKGLPLNFPGGKPYVLEATDTELLAQAFEWAANNEITHGETYNVTNGDVFMWEYAWSTIAQAFGMEEGEPVPQKLQETMPPREAEWAAIVDKYELRSPRTFKDFVGQGFFQSDYTLGGNNDEESPRPQIESTIKLRQAGFHEYIDTEECFVKWFRRFEEKGWLPKV